MGRGGPRDEHLGYDRCERWGRDSRSRRRKHRHPLVGKRTDGLLFHHSGRVFLLGRLEGRYRGLEVEPDQLTSSTETSVQDSAWPE